MRRGKQLRKRVDVEIGPTGPRLKFSEGSEQVVAETFVSMLTHYVLANDSELEVPGMVLDSLERLRQRLQDAMVRLTQDPQARKYLQRIERACADYVHRHPRREIKRMDEAMDPNAFDDLLRMRVEIAEAVADVLDDYKLPQAKELLNFIEFEAAAEPVWFALSCAVGVNWLLR